MGTMYKNTTYVLHTVVVENKNKLSLYTFLQTVCSERFILKYYFLSFCLKHLKKTLLRGIKPL